MGDNDIETRLLVQQNNAKYIRHGRPNITIVAYNVPMSDAIIK